MRATATEALVFGAAPVAVAFFYYFTSRSADRVKLVFLNGTGVCLFAKRLEHGESH